MKKQGGYKMGKQLTPQEVVKLIDKNADLIIPIANGEPIRLLDILEENAEQLDGVKIHQMLALRSRSYIQGEFEQLKHVSYFPLYIIYLHTTRGTHHHSIRCVSST